MINSSIEGKIRGIKNQVEYDAMKYSFETSNAPVAIKVQALSMLERYHPIYSGSINDKLNSILNDMYEGASDEIKLD
jgi:predicted P-loop ATPase